MTQEIYADHYGIETWDQSRSASVFVHIADSLAWREITGEELPPTPVDARTYTEHGLPWFSLYDETRRDINPATSLTKVKSVGTIDGVKDPGLAVPPEQTVRLGRPG